MSSVWTPGDIPNPLRLDLLSPNGGNLVNYLQTGRPITNVRSVGNALDQIITHTVNASDPYFAGGVRGGVDCTQALQNAHDYAQEKYDSAFVVMNPTGKDNPPKVNKGLNWDTNRVGLIANGQWDCTGFSDAVLFNFIQSNPNVNARPALNSIHELRNLLISGPGKNAGSTCFRLNDSSLLYTIAGLKFKGGGSWNWNTIAYMGDGCFFTIFDEFDFGTQNGFNGGTGTHVVMPSGIVNAGERNTFSKCRFANSGLYFSQGNGNATTFFTDTSFNYSDGRMMYLAGGEVYMDKFHLEASNDTDNWIYLENNSTKLHLDKLKIVVAGNKTKPIFNVAASVTTGGLIIPAYTFADISTYNTTLVEGTGRADVKNVASYSSGTTPHVGQCVNLLAYTDFNSLNAYSEWDRSGTILPAIVSGEEFYSGSAPFSFKFTGSIGSSTSASTTHKCYTGQTLSAKFWYKLKNRTVDGTFAASLQYLDKGGNVLAGGDMLVTAVNSPTDGVMVISNFPIRAPIGTSSARLSLSLFGISSGTPLVYVDVVEVNIQ